MKLTSAENDPSGETNNALPTNGKLSKMADEVTSSDPITDETKQVKNGAKNGSDNNVVQNENETATNGVKESEMDNDVEMVSADAGNDAENGEKDSLVKENGDGADVTEEAMDTTETPVDNKDDVASVKSEQNETDSAEKNETEKSGDSEKAEVNDADSSTKSDDLVTVSVKTEVIGEKPERTDTPASDVSESEMKRSVKSETDAPSAETSAKEETKKDAKPAEEGAKKESTDDESSTITFSKDSANSQTSNSQGSDDVVLVSSGEKSADKAKPKPKTDTDLEKLKEDGGLKMQLDDGETFEVQMISSGESDDDEEEEADDDVVEAKPTSVTAPAAATSSAIRYVSKPSSVTPSNAATATITRITIPATTVTVRTGHKPTILAHNQVYRDARGNIIRKPATVPLKTTTVANTPTTGPITIAPVITLQPATQKPQGPTNEELAIQFNKSSRKKVTINNLIDALKEFGLDLEYLKETEGDKKEDDKKDKKEDEKKSTDEKEKEEDKKSEKDSEKDDKKSDDGKSEKDDAKSEKSDTKSEKDEKEVEDKKSEKEDKKDSKKEEENDDEVVEVPSSPARRSSRRHSGKNDDTKSDAKSKSSDKEKSDEKKSKSPTPDKKEETVIIDSDDESKAKKKEEEEDQDADIASHGDVAKKLRPVAKFLYFTGLDFSREVVYHDLVSAGDKKHKQQKLHGHEIHDLQQMRKLYYGLHSKNKKLRPKQGRVCKRCPFSTESKSVMYLHKQQGHLDEKSVTWSCALCDFSNKLIQTFIFHMEAEHNIKATPLPKPQFFSCSMCSYNSSTKSHLTKHIAKCERQFVPEKHQFPLYDDINFIFRALPGPLIKVPQPPAPLPQPARQQYRPVQVPATTTVPQQRFVLQPAGPLPLLPKGVNYKPLPAMRPAPIGRNRYPPQTAQQFITNTIQQMKILPQQTNASQPIVIKDNGATSSTSATRVVSSTQGVKRPPTVAAALSQPRPAKAGKYSYEVCEICGGFVLDRQALRLHFAMAHNINLREDALDVNRSPPLACDFCTSRFFTFQGLSLHKARSNHARADQALCHICNTLTSDMPSHIKSAHNIVPNQLNTIRICPICGQCVLTEKTEVHIERVHNIKLDKPPVTMTAKPVYSCHQCSAQFTERSLLNLHIRKGHPAPSNKKCSICGALTQASGFTRHVLVAHCRKKLKVKLSRCDAGQAKKDTKTASGRDSPVVVLDDDSPQKKPSTPQKAKRTGPKAEKEDLISSPQKARRTGPKADKEDLLSDDGSKDDDKSSTKSHPRATPDNAD